MTSGGRVEGNRVRVFEDKRYDYDAHGNLTEKRTGKHTRLQMMWNAAHQLVKSVVTRHAQSPEPTVQTVKYVYDPFGRRIAKKDAFGTTRFAWDGNRLLCEARGQWSRTYVYEPGSFVPLAQMDAVTEEGGGVGECQVHHIHTDHLGTPNEVTDARGEITWASQYKAWGNVLRVTAGAPRAHALTVVDAMAVQDAVERAQPIRFLGQYQDSETGLHYNRFRYYDADIGRYVSQDPIGLAGGSNAYQYAPNPSGWVDPLGLAKGPCGCNGANNALETKLPFGVGGSGVNYDKAAGQGLYVLRDEAGSIKYVGRGDAPDRLATHVDSINKGDLIGEILWPNNLSKAQAKGLEQKLIDQHGGAARQNPNTPLLNQYRSFAPENPNATLYRNSVTNELWDATLKKVGK